MALYLTVMVLLQVLLVSSSEGNVRRLLQTEQLKSGQICGGRCANRDNDWTVGELQFAANALGGTAELDHGFGWRICAAQTKDQCESYCEQTPGCAMYSTNADWTHSDACCYFYKAGHCNSISYDDQETDYITTEYTVGTVGSHPESVFNAMCTEDARGKCIKRADGSIVVSLTAVYAIQDQQRRWISSCDYCGRSDWCDSNNWAVKDACVDQSNAYPATYTANHAYPGYADGYRCPLVCKTPKDNMVVHDPLSGTLSVMKNGHRKHIPTCDYCGQNWCTKPRIVDDACVMTNYPDGGKYECPERCTTAQEDMIVHDKITGKLYVIKDGKRKRIPECNYCGRTDWCDRSNWDVDDHCVEYAYPDGGVFECPERCPTPFEGMITHNPVTGQVMAMQGGVMKWIKSCTRCGRFDWCWKDKWTVDDVCANYAYKQASSVEYQCY